MAPGAEDAPAGAQGLDRLLAERGPAILRVWEGLAAGGPGEADAVRAAVAELLAAPAELVPPANGLPTPPPHGSALGAAARSAFPSLVQGLGLLATAVRELARALGSPLDPRDDRRLDTGIDRATAAAARTWAAGLAAGA